MLDRSYTNPPEPRSTKNFYQGTQPYIQNNEFLTNYEAE